MTKCFICGKDYEDFLRHLKLENAVELLEGKTGYKYRISFTQSVSSGIIAFSGDYFFDDVPPGVPTVLHDMIKNQEMYNTRGKGYKVASDIKPKVTKGSENTDD